MRRTADAIALITAAFWLGGCLAIGLSAGIMFGAAKELTVDASVPEVGELFALVFETWSWLGLALAALFAIARVVGWTARLRQGRFRRMSLLGVAAAVAVLTCAALGHLAILDAGVKRTEWARAAEQVEDEDATPAARAAEAERHAAFTVAHERSSGLGKALCAALAAAIVLLAVSLVRRETAIPASAGQPGA